MIIYAGFWARARRVELGLVLGCAAVSAALWGVELPTALIRPDLAPEQMVQLLAALTACAALLVLRPERGAVTDTAAVPLLGRRSAWLAVVLVVAACSAAAAAVTMPADVGAAFLRNVAAHLGAGLVVGLVSTPVAYAVPWTWFALSVTVGLSSVRGSADPAWWAYPLHGAEARPEVAVALLVAGCGSWALRRHRR